MKTKSILLVLIVSILSFYNLYSQIITFSGKNIKTGATVQLDSVRIINLTHPKDTVIKNNFSLDLSIFTGVDNTTSGNPISFSLEQNYPNSFENETKFEICMPQAGTVTIYLQNSLGEIITSFSNYLQEGKHQFQLDGSGLAIGPYFISAMANGEMKAIKIMKIGNSSGDKAEINYVGSGLNPGMILIPGDVFDFIGYSKGSKRDTIKSMVPKGGENYEFEYEILSDWNFTSAELVLSGFDIEYSHSLKDNDNDKSWHEVFKIDSKNIFNNIIDSANQKHCSSYQPGVSIDDTINFFKCWYDKWISYNNYHSLNFKCVIDTISKNIRNIYYKYYMESVEAAGTLYRRINETNELQIDSIPYKKTSDGKFSGEIAGVNIKSNIIKYVYSYHLNSEAYQAKQEDKHFIQLLNFKDESKISISLNP